ncbi:MAG: hypothetical protein U0324_16790 [Polyangiales bacterium]
MKPLLALALAAAATALGAWSNPPAAPAVEPEAAPAVEAPPPPAPAAQVKVLPEGGGCGGH